MSDSNPFDYPDESGTENEGDGTPSETSSMAELRKFAKRMEREAKHNMKELEELRQFQQSVMSEKREAAITKAFTEVGLADAHAKLFKALNPEIEVETISVDTVSKFADEYQLPLAGSNEVPEAPEVKPEGYRPVTVGSAAPLAMLTSDDVEKLMKAGDFASVNKAYAEGRVEKETVPWRI